MKRNIHCIIISCFLASLQVSLAQETAQTILQTIETAYETENYTQSLQLITSAKTSNTPLDSLQTAQLYFYKGASEYYLQQFDLSVASYNTAIGFCPTSDAGKNFKAELYYERAFSEYELGNYPESYESSKTAARLMEYVTHPNYDYLISIYADIAGTAAGLGFMDAAKNHLAKATSLYETHKHKVIVNAKEASKPVLLLYKAVEILNNKSTFTDNDIAFATAKIKDLQAIELQKKLNHAEKRMVAVAMNMLGDMYLRKSTVTAADCTLAHKYLNKATQRLDRTKYNSHFYQFQFNKVKAYTFEKKHAKALKLLNNLLKTLPKKDARLSYFQAEKAIILLALKDKQKALEAIQNSIENIHTGTTKLTSNYSNFVPSYDINETGLLVEIADTIVKKYPKDATTLKLAANMYRLGLLQFENCYREETLNSKLTHYYQSAIRGILKLQKLGYGSKEFNLHKLLNTMEVIENRLAWKKFHQNRLLNTARIPDSILQKEQDLRKSLVNAKKRKDTTAIFHYNKLLEQQLVTLKSEFPNIATFAFDNFDIKKIQSTLPTDKVIVKYKRTGDQLYAFTITKHTIDLYEITNSKHIFSTVENYYHQISKQQENTKVAAKLFEKLLPFNTNLFTTFTIIPDDVLHYIPFETLLTSRNTYFIEEATINYASHLVFVDHKIYQNQTSKHDDIIVFTPQYDAQKVNIQQLTLRDKNYRLFGAESESKSLTAIFPSTLFEAVLATKDNFIKHARQAKIIHLAMHANIDHEIPELSHLLFNKTGTDSKMYIEELYGLHLNADLAVLSACNTGKGSLDTTSSGMVSLNRAFTLAGVPSTLSSLWEVPDKITQEIMVDFYKNLRKGQDKSTALRHAKINYLKNTDDANFQKPFYWAGFVLHGDTAPIVLKQETSINFICVIASILCFIIIVIISFRIRRNTLKLF